MMRQIFSVVFLIVGIVILLGAFGHTFSVRHLHTAIDSFPIDPHVGTMIYVVWYFVSGCMFLFGFIIVWIWFRQKNSPPFFIATLIGALYAVTGIGGVIYRKDDSFMAFFIVLGGLLIVSTYVLKRQA
jgi:hypothetical protein